MLDNQFDEILRNKLEGHVSPVPEEMWQRVRPDKGRRRIALWVWLVFFVACAWGGYFILNGVSRRPTIQGPGNPAGYAAGADGAGDHGRGGVGGAANNGDDASNGGGGGNRASAGDGGEARPGSNGDLGGNRRDENNGGSRWNDEDDNDQANTSARLLLANPASRRNSDLNDLPAARLLPQKAALRDRTLQSQDSSHHGKPHPPANWHLDLYGAPDLGMKLRPLSYMAGLRLGRSLGAHFSASIGLQYLLIHEDPPADSITGWEKGRLNAIDIPFLIGYEAGGPHFKATVQAGGIFNAYSWFKSDFGIPSNDFYRGSTGISLYLGLNLAEKVSNHFSLFLEPYWRHRLSNKEINNLPGLSQENRAGLSGGIRYYFRKTKQH